MQGVGTSYDRFENHNGSRPNSRGRNDGWQNQQTSPSTWAEMREWSRSSNVRDDDLRHRQLHPWDRDVNATPPLDVHRLSEHSNTWKSEFYSGLGNQYAPMADKYTMQRNLQNEWFPHGPPAPAPPVTTTFVIAKAPQQAPQKAPQQAPPSKDASSNDDDKDDTTAPPKSKRKLPKRK